MNESKTPVLVVDDDPQILKLLARGLAPVGLEVLKASTASEAIRIAGSETPALVILDVDLPDQDGFEICGLLRRNPRTRHIPILFLTGRAAEDAETTSLDIGADDFMQKPFRMPALQARVKALLRRHQRDRDASPLTGLPGNKALEEELKMRADGREAFSVSYVDIRNFKKVNDSFGYAVGDRLILCAARLLSTETTETGRAAFVGHIGGDDFLAVTDAPISIAPLRRQFSKYVHAHGLDQDPSGRPTGVSLTVGQIVRPAGFSVNVTALAAAVSARKQSAKTADFRFS